MVQLGRCSAKEADVGRHFENGRRQTKFLLRSVCDVLRCPINLKTWGLADNPDCKLCGRPENLEHILSSCKTSLKDGRYTWLYDRVLASVAEPLDHARRSQKIKIQQLVLTEQVCNKATSAISRGVSLFVDLAQERRAMD